MDPSNNLLFYVVQPSSILVDYPITYYPDGSYLIDYRVTNRTYRFIQSAPIVNATDDKPANTSYEIACALLFEDRYNNGTIRKVFRNGTIAVFSWNGYFVVFDSYEVAPRSLFVFCDETPDEEKTIYEGGWWRNCSNGTKFKFGPQVDQSATNFIKAT